MTEPSDSHRDDAFVRALTKSYAPEPMTGAQRTAFDARLRERMHSRSRPWIAWPSLAAATCAVLLTFVWATNRDGSQATNPGPGERIDMASNRAGESSGAGEQDWGDDFGWTDDGIPSEALGPRSPANAGDRFIALSSAVDSLLDEEAGDDLFEAEFAEDWEDSEYAGIDALFQDYLDEIDG